MEKRDEQVIVTRNHRHECILNTEQYDMRRSFVNVRHFSPKVLFLKLQVESFFQRRTLSFGSVLSSASMSLTARHRWCAERILFCFTNSEGKENNDKFDDSKVQAFIRKPKVLAKFNELFAGTGPAALFVHYQSRHASELEVIYVLYLCYQTPWINPNCYSLFAADTSPEGV